MTQRVEIIEVSPRDGLQNEAVVLSAQRRVELICSLVEAGVTRMEAVSFVNPRLVPAMADAEEVMEAVPRDRGVSYIGLALNRRGVERAVAAGVDEVNFVLPATDSFAKANQNSSSEGLLGMFIDSAPIARDAGIRVSVTVAVAFGCPFEGDVHLAHVLELVRRIAGEIDTAEIALADTIGCGTPGRVREAFTAAANITDIPLRAHFHETRHTGLANSFAALESGVRRLDSSAGGLGGCPFAPGASGNLATEDLAWMLGREDYEHGLDVEAMIAIGRETAAAVETVSRSALSKAGSFPETALGPIGSAID